MDPLLLVAGAAVVAFDAYAYRIYTQGRASLESASSSSERAFKVKRHFDADQEPAGKAGARNGDSATVSSASNGRGAVPPVDIHVPFRRSAAPATTAAAYSESALAASELIFLKSEVESLRQKLSASEGKPPKRAFSAEEIDAKQAELHRMFMRRQISDDTYRTVCADIAKMRLGI